jgi:hypothetical protein
MNKSYTEIVKTCKLIDYTEEEIGRIERWEDTNTTTTKYTCLWFWSNEDKCPNTIYYV